MSADTKSTETNTDQSRAEWIRDHRDELEREANSDAPHAWVAKRFLQSLEDES
ncbi:hypothetical protein [Haloarcula laminariae]|uniref:hypothetical protein n=1 Tax=Haloarcula laminariae TaxID=2961577 RepID=UPI0024064C43|nr:hypothetical protein [Halomicroarcula sp. FL173]